MARVREITARQPRAWNESPELGGHLMASSEMEIHSSLGYALGYTDGEHKRLMRQAAMIAPITEGFFRTLESTPDRTPEAAT